MQSEVIKILLELLKFKSITPNDDGALNYISMILPDFNERRIEKNGVKNILLTKKFCDGPHICFAGHIDVVPAGDGWDTNAFSPTIIENQIFARGAQDMKSGLAAMICALKNVKKFNGTLSLLITSDEEGDAIYGTKEVLSILSSEDALPDFAIVAEPTCDKEFGDSLKIGRRGSINGVLKIQGKQGHVAYPDKFINPVDILAKSLDKISSHNLCDEDENFQASKIVITDIRGGLECENVTPNDVKIMFNVRNSNKIGEFEIREYFKEIFKDNKYSLELKTSSKPFLTNKDSLIVKNLTKSIENICKLTPKLNTTGGTSDAKYFAQFGIDVVEFGVRNDTIHAINERVSIDEVEKLYTIFSDLIENFD